MSKPSVSIALNDLWFWFQHQAQGPESLGSPQDCLRKYLLLKQEGLAGHGLEILLFPGLLPPGPAFPAWFYPEIAANPRLSVHLGHPEPAFLLKEQGLRELERLAGEMARLRSRHLVIHAHHFRERPARAAANLAKVLPGVELLLENESHEDPWGADPANLAQVMAQAPQLGFCLDTCHVDDCPQHQLTDFTDNSFLASRLAQVHFALSTRFLAADPYEEAGFGPHGALHALYSLAGQSPGPAKARLLARLPVVLEGVAPKGDQGLAYLKAEAAMIENLQKPSRPALAG